MKVRIPLFLVLAASLFTALVSSDNPTVLYAFTEDPEDRYVINGSAELSITLGEAGSIEHVSVLSATDKKFANLAKKALQDIDIATSLTEQNEASSSELTVIVKMNRKVSMMERFDRTVAPVYGSTRASQGTSESSWGVSQSETIPNYPELAFAPDPAP
jgi:hypothetical protein